MLDCSFGMDLELIMDDLTPVGKVLYSVLGIMPLVFFLFCWGCAEFDSAMRSVGKPTIGTKICSGISGVALIGWIIVLAQIWK